MFKISIKILILGIVIILIALSLVCFLEIKNTGIFKEAPKGILEGKVTIGPCCPVERPGVPCPCSPETYTLRLVVVYKTNGRTIVASQHLDTNGNYSIDLAPGNYLARVEPAGISIGSFQNVTIKSGQATELNFDIDTGIR